MPTTLQTRPDLTTGNLTDWLAALSHDLDDLADAIPEGHEAWYPALRLSNIVHVARKSLREQADWRYGADLKAGDRIRWRLADDSGWTPWLGVHSVDRRTSPAGADEIAVGLIGGLCRLLNADEAVQVDAPGPFDHLPEATEHPYDLTVEPF